MIVYKFYPKHWALDAIQRQRLKIATIDSLNDPFEFAAVDVTSKVARKAHKAIRVQLASEMGFISFSKTWQNPVTWSHYADNHKGVALGFEIPSNLLTEVEYVKSMVVPSGYFGGGGITDRALTKRLIQMKFAHWKYEEEFRKIEPLKTADPVTGLYFREISDDLELVEIILGANYDSQSAAEWHAEIIQMGVTIVTSRLAFGTFKVVKQNARRLQKPFSGGGKLVEQLIPRTALPHFLNPDWGRFARVQRMLSLVGRVAACRSRRRSAMGRFLIFFKVQTIAAAQIS